MVCGGNKLKRAHIIVKELNEEKKNFSFMYGSVQSSVLLKQASLMKVFSYSYVNAMDHAVLVQHLYVYV